MNDNIKCEICLSSNTQKNFETLLCGHMFCGECLYAYLKEKLDSHQVKTIVCPQEKCKKELNYYEVIKLLPQQEKEKYEKLLLNAMSPLTERSFQCPNCECVIIIPPKDQISFVECIRCRRTWCTNEECMGDWKNHANLTCRQYKEKFTKSNEEKNQELFKNKGWRHCPVCGALIDKTKNCNYVRCESPSCQKKTIFCYLCGVQLKNEQDIQTHYAGNLYQKCKNFQEEKKNLIEEKKNSNILEGNKRGNLMNNPRIPIQTNLENNQNQNTSRTQSKINQKYINEGNNSNNSNDNIDCCCWWKSSRSNRN